MVSFCLVSKEGLSTFMEGLELKHNWGQDVIFSLTETLVNSPDPLFLSRFDADQYLMS